MDEGLTLVLWQGYPELQPVMSNFADISIDLCPKEGMKFTATGPVFK